MAPPPRHGGRCGGEERRGRESERYRGPAEHRDGHMGGRLVGLGDSSMDLRPAVSIPPRAPVSASRGELPCRQSASARAWSTPRRRQRREEPKVRARALVLLERAAAAADLGRKLDS